jgi:ribosomal peptide maturation radical SAM protein 1
MKTQVLLVSMPFAPLLLPSIGLGLLKAALTSQQIHSKIIYFTLNFAERIGISLYQTISDGRPAIYDLLGEWIFSDALFDSTETEIENYINDVLRGQSPSHREAHPDFQKPVSEQFIQDILTIRSQVKSFLDDCVEEVLNCDPQIVAFTSVFQQHLASLVLAKRLKLKAPEIFIILGGANCEGVMGAEVIRQFPFVDATISGEGDLVFPNLVQRVLAGESTADLQGVVTQNNIEHLSIESKYLSAPPIDNMDALPFPDYDDYFKQLTASSIQLEDTHKPQLLFESSRGCWWGEKNHCTFCGLNGSSMAYRSKSADRALNELLYLANKYPNCSIQVVDNILDLKYFKDFIPKLAECDLDIGLFYEVKANLRKAQIKMLRDAGINDIQPGIESLSSQVLKLMQKGVTGIQNIQLLKWCQEYSVRPYWNILWGFPGEHSAEYEQMAKLIPLITHLQPPEGLSSIRVDRFSPNYEQPARYGFINIEPYPSYHYIYPFDDLSVTNLAYYFIFDYQKPLSVCNYTQPLATQIQRWHEVYEDSVLFYVDKEIALYIYDLRPTLPTFLDAFKPLHQLTGVSRAIYIACDKINTIDRLQQILNLDISTQEVEKILQTFIGSGLMIKEDNNYLSLAISLGDYNPSLKSVSRLLDFNRVSENPVFEKVLI